MARIDWNDAELAAIPTRVEVRDGLMVRAEPVVHRMKALAPRKTGRSAESITSQPFLESAPAQWTVRVSWERRFFYLRMFVLGTRRQPPRPEFMIEAAREA